MSKKIVQKIVLGGLVAYKQKILILQRHENEDTFPGLWELPSGKRESLEQSVDALVREVLEETGLVIEPIMPISTFEYTTEKDDEIRDSTQINYLVRPIGNDPDVKISNEHQDFRWVSYGELAKTEISDSTRKAMDAAFRVMNMIEKSGHQWPRVLV